MEPGTRTYLDENADKYTSRALRAKLIEAGHDPATVDATLAEWSAGRASQASAPSTTGKWLRTAWAVVLYLAGIGITLSAALSGSGLTMGLFPPLFVLLFAVAGFFVVRWVADMEPIRSPGNAIGTFVAFPILFLALLAGTCIAALPGMAIK